MNRSRSNSVNSVLTRYFLGIRTGFQKAESRDGIGTPVGRTEYRLPLKRSGQHRTPKPWPGICTDFRSTQTGRPFGRTLPVPSRDLAAGGRAETVVSGRRTMGEAA